MGLAFLITTENLQLLSERKVLKEAEYASLLDASQVVEAARTEARRIVAQAVEEAQRSREQGFTAGREEALRAHADQLLTDSLAAEQQLHALRASMAGIVVKAVAQFISQADPEELFETALLRVESLIRHEAFVTVRVSPEQERTLRLALARLREEAGWSVNISVQCDAGLPEGACVMQTASGTLEIGVDAQLDAFRRAVERSGVPTSGDPMGRH